MEDKIKNIIGAAILVVIIIAVLIGLYAFGVFEPSLPKYAPEGTDYIAYTNYKKLSKTKIFGAYKKTLAYEKEVKSAQNNGYDVEKLYDFEVCSFRNRNAEMRNKPTPATSVYRGSLMAAQFKKAIEKYDKLVTDTKKLNDSLTPEFREPVPSLSTNKIADKEAFVYEFGYKKESFKRVGIKLDDDTVQESFGDTKEGVPVSAPLEKNRTEVTKAIDTSALYSRAWKVDIPNDYRSKMGDDLKSAAYGLEFLTLNVYDAGKNIEVKLELTYTSKGNAQAALTAIEKLRKNYLDENETFSIWGFLNGKVGCEMLKAAEFNCKGKKIVAKVKYSQSAIIDQIEEEDQKERKREEEEERKKREASEK